MIDVHCHLNFHAFHKDVDECIQDAKQAGVSIIINVGTKLDSSEKAVALANTYENLYAIVGVHPHHADKLTLNQEARSMNQGEIATSAFGQTRNDENVILNESEGSQDSSAEPQNDNHEDWLKELEKLATSSKKVVGIGEIGLDYFQYQSNGIVDPSLQKEVFEAQIALAHTLKLPLQIHGRHAGVDILEILTHHKNLLRPENPGMFHCFAGDIEILKKALDLGFLIGFDGNITYPGLAPGETTSLSDIARVTPLERIVTETDSPFLTPIPYRGSRNTPSRVILVGEFLAKIKGISNEEMDIITTENAKKLFTIL